MWYVWLIAIGVFLVFEIATEGFLIFWLAIGSLLAMITSFFTDSILIQTAVFVISSSILIPLTKPLTDKYINKNKTPATNAFSLIGKKGIVLMDINPLESQGQVKVCGEIWSAKTKDESLITKGTEIEVLEIDGVKLVVSPIKITSNL